MFIFIFTINHTYIAHICIIPGPGQLLLPLPPNALTLFTTIAIYIPFVAAAKPLAIATWYPNLPINPDSTWSASILLFMTTYDFIGWGGVLVNLEHINTLYIYIICKCIDLHILCDPPTQKIYCTFVMCQWTHAWNQPTIPLEMAAMNNTREALWFCCLFLDRSKTTINIIIYIILTCFSASVLAIFCY